MSMSSFAWEVSSRVLNTFITSAYHWLLSLVFDNKLGPFHLLMNYLFDSSPFVIIIYGPMQNSTAYPLIIIIQDWLKLREKINLSPYIELPGLFYLYIKWISWKENNLKYKDPHFLCWILGVVPFNTWLISSWEENNCSLIEIILRIPTS